MTELIDIQLGMLLVSLALGALMGFSYDIIRIFRRLINHNLFFVSVEDMIYWLVWTIIVLDKIYVYNYGQIRFYIIVGLMIGLLAYKYTIGWVLMKISNYMLCRTKIFFKKHKKNLKNKGKKGTI